MDKSRWNKHQGRGSDRTFTEVPKTNPRSGWRIEEGFGGSLKDSSLGNFVKLVGSSSQVWSLEVDDRLVSGVLSGLEESKFRVVVVGCPHL